MKSEDGIRILRDIHAVPEGSSCAMIIRHADRGGELGQIVRNDEGLNETGIRRARELGSRLTRFNMLKAFSSPVGRCVDTAKLISEGFGQGIVPERTELLGMSAPFMVDTKRAYDKMRELGLIGFVDLYVNDKIDRSIALPCGQGMKMLLSYAIEKIKDMDNGLGLFITHDMIITPPMAYYFGYDFRTKGLVPFLDGIILYRTDNGLVARYDGREIPVSEEGTPLEKWGSVP
ncbi:MAG: histidine phosphatase family protein [Methanomassiliicoccales archaeon]|nr:MAG: histidine phosphatase family protein [Methanomassiliicoccales archaeon]